MATFGEGDPTDNAVKFYEWLSNKENPNNLIDIEFTVFGLGNTQYENYNSMGRNTNKFLESCGAKRVFEYGEGDDNSSLMDDFDSWKEKLWPHMKEAYPMRPKG